MIVSCFAIEKCFATNARSSWKWKSCWKTSDRQWLIELFRGKMERKKDTFWDETRDFIQKEQKNPILIRGSVVFL